MCTCMLNCKTRRQFRVKMAAVYHIKRSNQPFNRQAILKKIFEKKGYTFEKRKIQKPLLLKFFLVVEKRTLQCEKSIFNAGGLLIGGFLVIILFGLQLKTSFNFGFQKIKVDQKSCKKTAEIASYCRLRIETSIRKLQSENFIQNNDTFNRLLPTVHSGPESPS